MSVQKGFEMAIQYGELRALVKGFLEHTRPKNSKYDAKMYKYFVDKFKPHLKNVGGT